MTRTASTVDRLAALLLGVLLIVLGLGLLVWNTDWVPRIPQAITAPGFVTAAGTAWWPWALGVGGILLILIALRWLLSHTPKAKVKDLRLASGENGTITADLGAVADAAARALEEDPNIDSAKGKAVIDRGTRTIDLVVNASSPMTLTDLRTPIDLVGRQIADVLGDVAVATRTTVHVDKRPRRGHRVE
ncbi:hypothetical protein TUM20985_57300 [Mycobacterium antarcticum]|uniref:alkaline shock response membrane anchor protein AmaP n=1 Tax=unclassified Mycolicibacterium TaxID=2636767 RepID=UPI002392984D|nr:MULTISPECIES: alkaline shock response membrane anchor protein AmaP [unclassified Mycolicibacterium]BDX35183.1 hypothetical protein TUM20985_57300 [Mycolicibacterium sp. TUM20985]GLP78392.1 hypothetical protein TUM20983_55020 [Mycolicibacterium sp. TUM20983]GLP81445.1 hypothetical protein TUM20984_28650 [Mycolicibacterium sp. TUM20984]